jgi:hypothetical protein
VPRQANFVFQQTAQERAASEGLAPAMCKPVALGGLVIRIGDKGSHQSLNMRSRKI